jgi:hypothetical protein
VAGRQRSAVATVGVMDRSNATGSENPGDLTEVRRLIGWRYMDETSNDHGIVESSATPEGRSQMKGRIRHCSHR